MRISDWSSDVCSSDLTVNGRRHQVDVPPDMPLLWVIRDVIGLTGTKYGCGIAQCGACTVHVDGVAVRSCSLPVGQVQGAVTTIEGLGAGSKHPLQRAWAEHNVPQCGYCQTGQIMQAAAPLQETPKPTDEATEAVMTNICPRGPYQPTQTGRPS